MLMPVAGPSGPLKPPSQAVEPAQNARIATSVATATEGAPSSVPLLSAQGVDPPRTATAALRARVAPPEGADTAKDRPAGPPPAFVETLLERQARLAFEPPGAGRAADAGFAEARAVTTTTPPPSPDVDRRE